MTKQCRLWDTKTGKHKTTLVGHTASVLSVVYFPDGKTLLSTSNDKTIRLWNANTGKHKLTLVGHTKPVTSVAFSPDGKTFASVGNAILLWRIK